MIKKKKKKVISLTRLTRPLKLEKDKLGVTPGDNMKRQTPFIQHFLGVPARKALISSRCTIFKLL